MVTFKIQPEMVLFYVGQNVIGTVRVATYRQATLARVKKVAATFRDFARVAEIEDAIGIASDALIDAGLLA